MTQHLRPEAKGRSRTPPSRAGCKTDGMLRPRAKVRVHPGSVRGFSLDFNALSLSSCSIALFKTWRRICRAAAELYSSSVSSRAGQVPLAHRSESHALLIYIIRGRIGEGIFPCNRTKMRKAADEDRLLQQETISKPTRSVVCDRLRVLGGKYDIPGRQNRGYILCARALECLDQDALSQALTSNHYVANERDVPHWGLASRAKPLANVVTDRVRSFEMKKMAGIGD